MSICSKVPGTDQYEHIFSKIFNFTIPDLAKEKHFYYTWQAKVKVTDTIHLSILKKDDHYNFNRYIHEVAVVDTQNQNVDVILDTHNLLKLPLYKLSAIQLNLPREFEIEVPNISLTSWGTPKDAFHKALDLVNPESMM